MRRFHERWLCLALGLLALTAPAHAQQVAAVNSGIAFLRSQVAGAGPGTGESALIALAMIKAEVPLNDPSLGNTIRKLDQRFNGSTYRPERSGGTEIYEAACVIMALSNLDPNGRKAQISSTADYIAGKQNANGSWDYNGRAQGDCSISQYALLGLWEAENAGVPVSPGIWDRAARFYMTVQSTQGSWNYHRDESQYGDNLSMTAAGVGSLLICQRQLASYREDKETLNQYLVPILSEAQRARYKVSVSKAGMASAIKNGLAWITANFALGNETIVGQSPFYCLYGIERVGALAGKENLGRVDWYDQGARFIASKQGPGGSWSSQHGEVPNTVWAILFLTKSTQKTVERITVKRLGSGELFGGKGLPRDLSTISEAGGRLVARPMDGAVEGMLSVLEDPRSDNADSALAGLLARYQAQGPRALQPYKDRFRKLLYDRDPGVRRVAAWAVPRIGDLAMAPALIESLADPDESVVNEARLGLQLLARKIEGFGPPPEATPEQREAAIKGWKAWYETVRPLKVDLPSSLDSPASKGAGRTGR
jgi:hypothetical protein